MQPEPDSRRGPAGRTDGTEPGSARCPRGRGRATRTWPGQSAPRHLEVTPSRRSQARASGTRRTSVPTGGRASRPVLSLPLTNTVRTFRNPDGHCLLAVASSGFLRAERPQTPTTGAGGERPPAARPARPFPGTPAPRQALGNVPRSSLCSARGARAACQGKEIEPLTGRAAGRPRPPPSARAAVRRAPWQSLRVCSEAEKRRNHRPRRLPSGRRPPPGRPFWPCRAANPRPAVDPITGT